MSVRRYGHPPISDAGIEAARDELDRAQVHMAMLKADPGLRITNVWTSPPGPPMGTPDPPGPRVARHGYAGLVPLRWRPSPADHHDRGEDCGEIECERCNP